MQKEISNNQIKDAPIRIINLGGVEELGKNMTVIEYKDTIIVINAGSQFNAPNVLGVDYIIPNTKYLEDNKHKIKAVVFTSSSYEYTGAFPYINELINSPRVYARAYTNQLLKLRSENSDLNMNNEFIPVEEDLHFQVDELVLNFKNIKSLNVDALNLSITTPYGDIVYAVNTTLEDDKDFADLSSNTLCLLADSLNSEGNSDKVTNQDVKNKLKEMINNSVGRILINTFANNITQINLILELAKELNKKIILESQTIKENIEAAQEIGFVGDITNITISCEDALSQIAKGAKANDFIFFLTGNEGKEIEKLNLISEDESLIKISEGDTVLMSTHRQHNQRNAQNIKDSISRAGALIYHLKDTELLINNSGVLEHINKLHRIIRPKFFIPIVGCHYMLRVHADIERRLGAPENHIIVPDNGMVIEIKDNGQRIGYTREKIETGTIVVDGNKIGKLHNAVLKDREILREQGVFLIISLIDMKNHKLKKNPDIATRGFVYIKESQELLVGARDLAKVTIEDYLNKNYHIEIDDLKDVLQGQVSKYLMAKTAKQPLVTPIIIKI